MVFEDLYLDDRTEGNKFKCMTVAFRDDSEHSNKFYETSMSLGRKDSVRINRRRTAIVFCTLSKQVGADHIYETQLLNFAIGAFHGDYKPGG